MIVILYQNGCGKLASSSASDLREAFARYVQVRDDSGGLFFVVAGGAVVGRSPDRDVRGRQISCRRQRVYKAIPQKEGGSAILLPVAIDPSFRSPPEAAAGIKALEYDDAAKGLKGKLVNRVGGMLGLLVQGRNTKIFISYRASDGTAIATQIYDQLTSIGHNVFLDEAKEVDGYTKILPGSPVQREIDEALDKSSLLLLIDTPAAPASKWIVHEVETADSLLLPILPICFRDRSDPTQGPRFRSLLALQPWVQLERPDPPARPQLSAGQLNEIVTEAERYLCEIFQRKCRVPFIVEKEFISRGFAWSALDQRLLMFTSSKGSNWRLSTKVLSHCSLFDPGYGPAMRRFASYLKEARRHNYSLFLYDGELLPEPQLQELVKESKDDSVIILHHQELAALIDSNFTNLPAAA